MTCCGGSRKGRSTRPSSSPIRSDSIKDPACMKPSGTRKTVASKLFSNRIEEHPMSNDQKFLASREAADSLARSLGWFSLGLGALELFGAKSLCRWMGTEQHETLIR